MSRLDMTNEDLRDVWRDEDLLEDLAKAPLYVGATTAEDMARVTHRPAGVRTWTDEDEERETMPPPREGFTRCSKCSAQYDFDAFRALEYVGAYPGSNGRALELRNCALPHCKGTTNRHVDEPDDVDVVAETRRSEGDDAMAEERAETERAWREGTF